MVRIAAVGDLHLTPGSDVRMRPLYQRAAAEADVLLLAGDLTESGLLAEGEAVRDTFRGLDVPTIAILGNHDHHGHEHSRLSEMLTDVGVTVLDGTATTVQVGGTSVGIAGIKGSGGGFEGSEIHPFGEDEMKLAARFVADTAAALDEALDSLADVDLRIALTHYAPVRDTLDGEPREIYVFLGNRWLEAAIDGAGSGRRTPPVDLALHGHAHYGAECGTTAAGVPVRNVAAPVIRAPYAIYELPGPTRVV